MGNAHTRAPGQGERALLGRETGERSLEKDGRKQHRRHSSDLTGFSELPALVYITPRQGSRQEVWIASLNKDLPGCTQVRGLRPGCSSGSSPHGLVMQGRSLGHGPLSGNGSYGPLGPLLSKACVRRGWRSACTSPNMRK